MADEPAVVMSACWNCGTPVAPLSAYSPGRYHCVACGVLWANEDYWRLKEGGYVAHLRSLEKAEGDWMQRYHADELVDFGKPGAPSAPA